MQEHGAAANYNASTGLGEGNAGNSAGGDCRMTAGVVALAGGGGGGAGKMLMMAMLAMGGCRSNGGKWWWW